MKQEKQLRCKNTYCKGLSFVPIIDLENNNIIAIKCKNCGAIYDTYEIIIKDNPKREGAWNSYKLRSFLPK